MPFELLKLNYDYNALEPYIDARTMEIHHSKHHQTYITNLNKALEPFTELHNKTIEELITSLADLPEQIRTAVKNNGGGHYNHTLFWNLMSPEKTDLSSELIQAINQKFDSLDNFKELFSNKALTQFGSGWAWLIKNDSKLEVVSTPNQENPLMTNPNVKILLGIDVWEHAYYLNYQNRRADYIKEWWNVVNWNKVNEQFLA